MSDLRDVSGRVEGVTGFLRVTKTLAEEAVSTISGKGGVFVDNLAQQGVRLPVRASQDFVMNQLRNTSDVR